MQYIYKTYVLQVFKICIKDLFLNVLYITTYVYFKGNTHAMHMWHIS